MRLDQWLVELGLAPSRSKAIEWIKRGYVAWADSKNRWQISTKPSLEIEGLTSDRVKVELPEKANWVSRGGEKLYSALEKVALNVQGRTALDVGTSTGGFAECLIRQGAKAVLGLDVGHDQLHPNLRLSSHLILVEGFNARELEEVSDLQGFRPSDFDIATIDLSFISIYLVLKGVARWLKPQGPLMALLKPQFEVGPEGLNKKGIVKPDFDWDRFLENARDKFEQAGFEVKEVFPCEIKGGDGNQEYFIYAIRKIQ